MTMTEQKPVPRMTEVTVFITMPDEAGRAVTYAVGLHPTGISITPYNSAGPIARLTYPAAYAAGLKEQK